MSRRDARRAALDVLYAADVRGVDPSEIEQASDRPLASYARHLVDAVRARREEIDGSITRASRNWPLERLSVVDRNVLRLAVAEMWDPAVPDPVAISEAVHLAKTYSGEEAGRFVNGVLSGIMAAGEPAPQRDVPPPS